VFRLFVDPDNLTHIALPVILRGQSHSFIPSERLLLKETGFQALTCLHLASKVERSVYFATHLANLRLESAVAEMFSFCLEPSVLGLHLDQAISQVEGRLIRRLQRQKGFVES